MIVLEISRILGCILIGWFIGAALGTIIGKAAGLFFKKIVKKGIEKEDER